MTTFPKLKTDAVAQYPLTRQMTYQNQTLTFVDGTRQRYRDCASVRLQWRIRLVDLDEGELAAVEEFFAANQGSFGSFAFTDPQDGQVYDDCSIAADGMEAITASEMRGMTTVIVAQNRK
jgi:uncharacterized protein DUF2460